MIKGVERKIGEVFDFNGIKLRVQDAGYKASCNGCYFCVSFYCQCYELHHKQLIGECYRIYREDGKDVIFMEVQSNKDKENKL